MQTMFTELDFFLRERTVEHRTPNLEHRGICMIPNAEYFTLIRKNLATNNFATNCTNEHEWW
jgi:hypothetical protein